MQPLKKIPAAVAALIPCDQLKITRANLLEFSDAIEQLETSLQKCPNIGETDRLKEHPAIFHYFYGSTDIYICEYDRKDLMFGYAILGGDLRNSEWGYFKLSDLTSIRQYNIDYHFNEQSIEAALYASYPSHFKKPQSCKDLPYINKNEPLPEVYRDFPYRYTKTKFGTILGKNNDEVFLQGDAETRFFTVCNRLKQKGIDITRYIQEYFPI